MNTPVGFVVIWTVDTVSKRRSGADSDTLSDWLESISVILPGLISETEEGKEDKGTENSGPAWELHSNLFLQVATPYYRRDLLDVGEIVMNILPTDVRVEGKASLKSNDVDGNGYGEQDFSASKAHESNESIGGHVAIAWE